MKKVIEHLPSLWTESPLKEHNTFLRRGKSPEYCENNQGLFVINQDCIRWNSIDLSKVKFHIFPSRIVESFYLRSGDILINSTGTGTIGRVNQWLYPDIKAVADSHVTVLRVTEESIDSKFARYFLASELGQRYLESVCYTGSTNQIELSKRYLSKMRLPCPPLQEQKTIAEILYKVDLAIEAVENSIKAAERLKISLMQNLLTGKLKPDGSWRSADEFYEDEKFGKIPKGWEINPLKKLAKIQRGKFSHRPRNEPRFYGGNHPFVQTSDVVNSIFYLKEYSQTLSELGIKVSRKFKKGTIIITIAANIGDVAIATYDVFFPDSLIGINSFVDKIDKKYLLLSLMTKKQFLNQVATESAQKNINYSNLRPLSILHPKDIAEQEQISDKIESVFKTIEIKESKIKSLRKLKKSLMQNLLTGKVRIDVNKINTLEEV